MSSQGNGALPIKGLLKAPLAEGPPPSNDADRTRLVTGPHWAYSLRRAVSSAVELRTDEPLALIAHLLRHSDGGPTDMSEPTDAYVKRHDLATAVQSAVDAAGLGADEPQQAQDSRADVERLARACAAEQVAASRRRLERAQREESGRETGPFQQQERPKSALPPSSPPPSRQRQRKRLPPPRGELRAELEAATFRADNAERELSRAASQNADLRGKIKEMQGEAMLLRARAEEAEALRVTNEALRAEQASFYAALTKLASLRIEDLLAAVKRMRVADRGGAAAVASQLGAAAGDEAAAAAAGSFSSAELTAAALEIARDRQAKRQQERLRRATLQLEHERQLREQQAQQEQQAARARASAQKQRSKTGRGRGGVGRGGRGATGGDGGAEALQHWTQADGLEDLAPYVADQYPIIGAALRGGGHALKSGGGACTVAAQPAPAAWGGDAAGDEGDGEYGG